MRLTKPRLNMALASIKSALGWIYPLNLDDEINDILHDAESALNSAADMVQKRLAEMSK